MSVTPTAALLLAGAPIAAGPNPDGTWPALMALDGVTVKWGRGAPLEQPKPATANVAVLDPSGEWAAGADLIGQPVAVQWTAAGETHTYFTGRVASVTVTPTKVRNPDGNTVHGARVALSCTSLLTDLGNVRPASGAWPAETLAARRARVAALAAPAVSGIGTRATWDLAPLAAVAKTDGATVLQAVTELLANAGADRWTYDPDTRRIEWLGRRTFDPADAAHLARDSARPGVYVAGPSVQRSASDPVQPAVGIPASVIAGDGTVTKDQAARLTRATVTYPDPANPTGSLTVTALTGADEALLGSRSADSKVQIADTTRALSVAQDIAALVAGEASGWVLPGMRWDTSLTNGFDTLEQARLLLAGTERTGVFWLAGSLLPALGVLPLFGVLGGTILYRHGAWTVDFTPAPTSLTGPPAPGVTWEDLDPSLTWDDPGPHSLDDSVTYEDMRWVPSGAITIGA